MKTVKLFTLETILDSLPDVLFWKDLNGRYLGANQKFLRLLGLKDVKQLLNKTDEKLPWSTDYKEYFQEHDREVISQKKAFFYNQKSLLRCDNTKIHLTTDKYPLLDENGQVIGVLGVTNNIAEKNLNTHLYLENIIERTPYYIFWKDKNLVYLGCNLRFANLVGGKTTDEVIGKTDFDLNWGSGEPELFQQGDYDVMHGKPEVNVEEILVRPDKSQIVMLVSKVPLRDQYNNCIGVLGISTDITERKQMEESLKIAKEKAEISNQAKTQFISNMSHDIRTPLTGIIGMAAILEENCSNEEMRSNAHLLRLSGDKLLALLNNVLEVLSMEHVSDDQPMNEAFDLKQSFQNLYDLVLPCIHQKSLQFKITIDPTTPNIILNDRFKIERILLNLITNSIKFTNQGKIELKVKSVETQENRCKVEFKVIDTGIGISEDQIPRIFERFYRATPTYEGVYQGHGVGLYIVNKFVSLLDGEISVDSQPGVGSTFSVILPTEYEFDNAGQATVIQNSSVTISSSEKLKPANFNDNHNSNKPTLLLVEDDPIAARVAQSFFSTVGFECTNVKDGETAFKYAKKGRFSLIVSDIGLPGMTGNEWTAAYRHWEWVSGNLSVPIIGLTAHATGKAKEDCIAAGMNDVLVKPINFKQAEKLYEFIVRERQESDQNIDEIHVSSLGFELPATEAELLQLEQFPLFDEQEALKTLGNNYHSLTEIVNLLVKKDLSKEVSNLINAFANYDWETIELIAHKLKGSALYCGTQRMRYACQYIERYRLAGHTDLQEKLFGQLISVLEKTRYHLLSWLNEKPQIG